MFTITFEKLFPYYYYFYFVIVSEKPPWGVDNIICIVLYTDEKNFDVLCQLVEGGRGVFGRI